MKLLGMHTLHVSSVALIVAVLYCGDLRADDSEEYPATDCGADTVQYLPPCGCGTLSPTNSKCVGSINTATVQDPGNTRWLLDTKMARNCNDACGDAEVDDPVPITVTQNVSVSFTNSVTDSGSVTGGISGGTFLAGINASVSTTIGSATQDGVTHTVGGSVSVPLPSCKWQILEAKLQVVEGKKVQCSGQISKVATFTCPHETYTHTWSPVTVTVSKAVDGAIQSTGAYGTKTGSGTSGTCPPDPPEPPY